MYDCPQSHVTDTVTDERDTLVSIMYPRKSTPSTRSCKQTWVHLTHLPAAVIWILRHEERPHDDEIPRKKTQSGLGARISASKMFKHAGASMVSLKGKKEGAQ